MFGTIFEPFYTTTPVAYTLTSFVLVDQSGILINNLPSTISRITDTTNNKYYTITETALATYINSLISERKIPGTPPDPAADGNKNISISGYIRAQNEFLQIVKDEYEYYNNRYKYALTKFLELLASTATGATPSSDTQSWLDAAILLNTRVNDIVQIVTYLTSYYLTQSRENNDTINGLNSLMETRSSQIKVEGELLRRKGGDKELYQKMVEYSTVKARATNNLLSLYGCMNIVALGILFYVYKATDKK
jgi:hypothetical protein